MCVYALGDELYALGPTTERVLVRAGGPVALQPMQLVTLWGYDIYRHGL